MIVADAVGCAYFGAFLAVNLRSATPNHEITALYTVTILSTVAFELLYPHVSAKTTQWPLRDLQRILVHPIMLFYLGQIAIEIYVAAYLPSYHWRCLERWGGYVNHVVIFLQRNVREHMTRHEREHFVRSDLDMGWYSYLLMMNLSTFQHSVLRYHARWVIIELFSPDSGYALGDGNAPWSWSVAVWVGYVVGLLSLAPAIILFQVVFYYFWHRWFHEDPLLWRCIHKFHHLFKHPGPLSAGSEVHLEWCMSYANLVMFLYPMYQPLIFGHDAVRATDLHDHDILTQRGGAHLHHIRHHLYATGNFSAPELDAKYGTLLRADGRRFPPGTDWREADLCSGTTAIRQKAAMKAEKAG